MNWIDLDKTPPDTVFNYFGFLQLFWRNLLPIFFYDKHTRWAYYYFNVIINLFQRSIKVELHVVKNNITELLLFNPFWWRKWKREKRVRPWWCQRSNGIWNFHNFRPKTLCRRPLRQFLPADELRAFGLLLWFEAKKPHDSDTLFCEIEDITCFPYFECETNVPHLFTCVDIWGWRVLFLPSFFSTHPISILRSEVKTQNATSSNLPWKESVVQWQPSSGIQVKC